MSWIETYEPLASFFAFFGGWTASMFTGLLFVGIARG